MLRVPRGTNDILPPESHKWAYIEALRRLSKIYNFEEIDSHVRTHRTVRKGGGGGH